MIDFNSLSALQTENARLIALLEAHKIDWRLPIKPTSVNTILKPELLNISTAEKIALFRRLFRGRTDVYPIRWESQTTTKVGYAPACANEWRKGVCEKPRIKCSDCGQRVLLPLTDNTIYKHLAGDHTIGIFPLMPDDSCYFLAADFDKADWQADALGFVHSCHELGVPVALEISRSGKGAHAWVFFSSKVSARDARRLGTAIISHTCTRTRQLKLTSYDRLFPNQDSMPKGGFGNLIALPLQKNHVKMVAAYSLMTIFSPTLINGLISPHLKLCRLKTLSRRYCGQQAEHIHLMSRLSKKRIYSSRGNARLLSVKN